MGTAHSQGRSAAAEWGVAGLIAALLAAAVWRLHATGSLPQPFFYNPSDSLMDLYNTAYWANRPGAYDVWHAIYPPLSFLFLRLGSLHACYRATAIEGRACDPLPAAILAAFWLGGVVLCGVIFRRADRATWAPRLVAMAAGLPMAYGLERGNLLIVAFFFLLVWFAAGPRRRLLRILSLAIAINFKPYLALVIVPYAIAGRWREFASYLSASLALYFATFLAMGAGSPLDLLNGVRTLIGQTGQHYWNNLYNATSYGALTSYLGALAASAPGGGGLLRGAAAALGGLVVLAHLGALACFVLAAKRPERVKPTRLAALALVWMLACFGCSGYSEIFLVFFAFAERWRGWPAAVVVCAAYLLCLPADLVLGPADHLRAFSFLGGREVWTSHGLALGQLARPAVVLAAELALVAANCSSLVRRNGAGSTSSPVRGVRTAAVLQP
jgi:hypothetical protein